MPFLQRVTRGRETRTAALVCEDSDLVHQV
jgi:hypothetical protein